MRSDIKKQLLDTLVEQIKSWLAVDGGEVDLRAFLQEHLRLDQIGARQVKKQFSEFLSQQTETSADYQLAKVLQDDEHVRSVVFGDPLNVDDSVVPKEIRKKSLSPKQAEDYLQGWSLVDDTPNAKTCPTMIWTDKRILWNKIAKNGSTKLVSIPRSPAAIDPADY